MEKAARITFFHIDFLNFTGILFIKYQTQLHFLRKLVSLLKLSCWNAVIASSTLIKPGTSSSIYFHNIKWNLQGFLFGFTPHNIAHMNKTIRLEGEIIKSTSKTGRRTRMYSIPRMCFPKYIVATAAAAAAPYYKI